MSYLNAIERVWTDTIRIWTPPPKLKGSEWADRYFYITTGDPNQGKWKTLPYQKGILDAMTDPTVEKITIIKSARTGYTKMVTIVIAYHIHQDPCNILMVQPTIEDGQGYSKDEIAPMLAEIPVLEQLAPAEKTRDSKNTILRKEFPGMTLMITGANSARGFRRVHARKVIFDEVSAYPPAAGNEGDQILLGSRRADFYWNKMIILGSTPTFKGDRIEESWDQSDKRRYHVPCPHCNFMQPLRWANIDFSKEGTTRAPVYICEGCEKPIEYRYHRWMIENGRWVAEGEFNGHAGFHIWAAYSYSPNATWRHIVDAFQEAKGNRETLKTWINTWLGETWEEEGDRLDLDTLLRLRETFDPVMPAGTALLTAAVDVQKDRFEILFKAWGRDEESWDMDYVVLIGNPALKESWDRLDMVLQKPYQHQNGSTMNINIAVIDSGDQTDAVYAYVKPREQSNIFAIKGDNGVAKPIITRPSRRNKARVNLFMVGVNTGKDIVSARFQMEPSAGANATPGKVHFPDRFPVQFFEQLVAEKKYLRMVKGARFYRWELTSRSARNEAFDLEVYSLAALRILCPDTAILNQYVDAMEGKKQLPQRATKMRILHKGINNDR